MDRLWSFFKLQSKNCRATLIRIMNISLLAVFGNESDCHVLHVRRLQNLYTGFAGLATPRDVLRVSRSETSFRPHHESKAKERPTTYVYNHVQGRPRSPLRTTSLRLRTMKKWKGETFKKLAQHRLASIRGMVNFIDDIGSTRSGCLPKKCQNYGLEIKKILPRHRRRS